MSEGARESVTTSSGVGLVETQPLVRALHDNSSSTRLAAVDALTRLPLEPDVWFEVGEYVHHVLGDDSLPERPELIEIAARVPLRSVREHLRSLTESGDLEQRRRAATALAATGDARAAGPLLALLDDAPSAPAVAEALTLIDTSPEEAELERRWSAMSGTDEEGRTSFWLAVALASQGRGAPLASELEQLSAEVVGTSDEGDLLDMWPDDSNQLWAGLTRIAPLPDSVRPALEREWPSTFVGNLVSEVLFTTFPEEETPPAVVTAPLETFSEVERALVRKALGKGLPAHDPYQAKVVARLADDLHRKAAVDLDRRRFHVLLVSELLSEAVRLSPAVSGERMLGDDAVLLAASLGARYAPDVEGLADVWRRSDPERELARNQIAWLAGRSGLGDLMGGLGGALALDTDASARLITAAASWTGSADPPLTPAGDALAPPAAARPPRADELIQDLPMAGPPPGLDNTAAEPPEPAPAPAPAEPAGAEPAPEPEAPEAPERRWILVWVTDVAKPDERLTYALHAGAVHEVAVAIGPNQEGALAAGGDSSFDEELGEVADMEELTVTFVAKALSEPQSASIYLPRHGTSRPCTFQVKLPADAKEFEAEITVHHRNRVVQMARLRGPVAADAAHVPPDARIELKLAQIVPLAALADREPVDAGVVRTPAGTNGVAGSDLIYFDDDRIGRVVPNLVEILTRLSTGEAARSRRLEDGVDDLRELVFQGCDLYGAIARPLLEQLQGRKLDRLQVLVDETSDFFPLELVYDLPVPSEDATLCPGWKTALRTGVCPEGHAQPEGARQLAHTICPIGFWALSKVIERKVVGEGCWCTAGAPPPFEIAVSLEPTADRHCLAPPRRALFAASSKVDAVEEGGISRVLKALKRIAGDATYAEDWDEWVSGIEKRPTLLVLLSHTSMARGVAALEIGKAGARCRAVQLKPVYVRSSAEDAPIVLLLGCETAVSDDLQSFVARFQDLGAALVVGTVASVLGQRAAPMAQAIAAELGAASKRKKPIAAGDLITSLRRKLLEKGELTALCLTAYGDAGWQLGRPGK